VTSSVVQGMNIDECKKIISREMILTEGYELPLNAFQLSGLNRRYRVLYSWSTLRFGVLS